MKLTIAQQKVINKAKELEKEHGKGNVFLRYINDYWNILFVIHKQGETSYKPIFGDENKINSKIINSLQEKGLIQIMDNNHIVLNDVMDIKYSNERFLVGSRIITEVI